MRELGVSCSGTAHPPLLRLGEEVLSRSTSAWAASHLGQHLLPLGLDVLELVLVVLEGGLGLVEELVGQVDVVG